MKLFSFCFPSILQLKAASFHFQPGHLQKSWSCHLHSKCQVQCTYLQTSNPMIQWSNDPSNPRFFGCQEILPTAMFYQDDLISQSCPFTASCLQQTTALWNIRGYMLWLSLLALSLLVASVKRATFSCGLHLIILTLSYSNHLSTPKMVPWLSGLTSWYNIWVFTHDLLRIATQTSWRFWGWEYSGGQAFPRPLPRPG